MFSDQPKRTFSTQSVISGRGARTFKLRPCHSIWWQVFAAQSGAYIEVVTESDERLRMNEKDLPGGRAMRHLVRSRSELQDRVTELIEQQTAISEVLRAIANSPHDLQPIFDAILDSSTRLCRADVVTLRLSEESGLRLVAMRGEPLWLVTCGHHCRRRHNRREYRF